MLSTLVLRLAVAAAVIAPLATVLACSPPDAPIRRDAAQSAMETDAAAPTSEPVLMRVSGTGSSLNMRSGPGTEFSVVATIPEGTVVEVVDSTNQDWYQVSFAQTVGFCFAQYLTPVTADDDTPGGALLTVSEVVGDATHSISQGYGPTSFNYDYSYCDAYGSWGGQNSHCGLDVAIAYGTPLYAPAASRAVVAGGSGYFNDDYNSAAGELRLETSDGTQIILGHMSRIDVASGAAVDSGMAVGESGSAGSGAHVHLEVRVPDPSFESGYRTVDPVEFLGR